MLGLFLWENKGGDHPIAHQDNTLMIVHWSNNCLLSSVIDPTCILHSLPVLEAEESVQVPG